MSPSIFAAFALIAWSKVPEGNGIPTLIKIANDMPRGPSSYGMTSDTATRTLPQIYRQYPEAGEELIKLAATNRINGWPRSSRRCARSTGLQLVTKSSDIFQNGQAEFLINTKGPETWSDAEID